MRSWFELWGDLCAAAVAFPPLFLRICAKEKPPSQRAIPSRPSNPFLAHIALSVWVRRTVTAIHSIVKPGFRWMNSEGAASYCGLVVVVELVVLPPLEGLVSVFEWVSELPEAP